MQNDPYHKKLNNKQMSGGGALAEVGLKFKSQVVTVTCSQVACLVMISGLEDVNKTRGHRPGAWIPMVLKH